MADHELENVDAPERNDAPERSNPPEPNNEEQPPEWTSKDLMAMVRNGQRLSAKDKKRLDIYVKEQKALKNYAQQLAELEGRSETLDNPNNNPVDNPVDNPADNPVDNPADNRNASRHTQRSHRSRSSRQSAARRKSRQNDNPQEPSDSSSSEPSSPSDSDPDTPSESSSSSSSSPDSDHSRRRRKRASRVLKITTVRTLERSSTLRQWGDWKLDLQRVFDADPYLYKRKDHNKVSKALDHTDEDLRSMWNSHITQKPRDRKRWKVFLNWTKTNIDQGLHSKTTLHEQYQAARQKADQSPREFNVYLTSLERDLNPKDGEDLAMAFYTRLQFRLRRQFRLSNTKMPKTRTKMVEAAQNIWEGMQEDQKQPHKKKDFENSNDKRAPKKEQSSGYRRQSTSYHYKKKTFTKDPSKKDAQKGQQKTEKAPPKPPPHDKAVKERLCFRCGSDLHFVPDCPEPPPPAAVKAVSSRRYRDRSESSSPSPPPKRTKTYVSNSDPDADSDSDSGN
jgi:hypothetical protein